MEIKPETLRKLRERLDGYHARHKMVPKSGQGQFEAQLDIEWPRISKALEEMEQALAGIGSHGWFESGHDVPERAREFLARLDKGGVT